MWGELLGIDGVGIYDNFLELGGDSLLGVQLASKATARGVRLSPKHLFDHPNIVELAAAIDAGLSGNLDVLREAQGAQPLLPIQAWLTERMPEFRSWVKVLFFSARDAIDVAALQEALERGTALPLGVAHAIRAARHRLDTGSPSNSGTSPYCSHRASNGRRRFVAPYRGRCAATSRWYRHHARRGDAGRRPSHGRRVDIV